MEWHLKNTKKLAAYLGTTQDDFEAFEKFRTKIYEMYWKNNMSTGQIKSSINFPTSQITNLFSQLNIPLRSMSEAKILKDKENGKHITDEKRIYVSKCAFKFALSSWPIQGKELLIHGMYHPVKNKAGCSKDHIMSVCYGWENKIDPYYISHPANCQILLHRDNIKKGSGSGYSSEQLIEKCNRWNNQDYTKIEQTLIYTRTKSHSKNISTSLKKKNISFIRITDGVINKSISKNSPIPEGFRRGMIKNSYFLQTNLSPLDLI